MSVVSVLRRVAALLEREHVPYMVIGGIAVAVWGEPRGTRDVDVTVDVDEGDLGRLVDVMSELGVPVTDDPVSFAMRTRVLPIRTSEGIDVDLVIATLSFELDAIARAADVSVEGQSVRVCSAEDLIVHKIVSERSRDHEDVAGILRRQAAKLDLQELDRTVRVLADGLDEPAMAERYADAKRKAGLT